MAKLRWRASERPDDGGNRLAGDGHASVERVIATVTAQRSTALSKR
jgi:hypothetical protein